MLTETRLSRESHKCPCPGMATSPRPTPTLPSRATTTRAAPDELFELPNPASAYRANHRICRCDLGARRERVRGLLRSQCNLWEPGSNQGLAIPVPSLCNSPTDAASYGISVLIIGTPLQQSAVQLPQTVPRFRTFAFSKYHASTNRLTYFEFLGLGDVTTSSPPFNLTSSWLPFRSFSLYWRPR